MCVCMCRPLRRCLPFLFLLSRSLFISLYPNKNLFFFFPVQINIFLCFASNSQVLVNLASVLANNPQLMSMLQGRLGGLVGAPSGYLQTLGPDVRRRVKGLKSLQHKHSALEVEFQKEILTLEKKYLALYTPLYQKRAEFVAGKVEPTDAEVAEGVSEDEDEEDEDEDDEEKKDADEEKVEGTLSIAVYPFAWLMGCLP
jgi:hypothetical protein